MFSSSFCLTALLNYSASENNSQEFSMCRLLNSFTVTSELFKKKISNWQNCELEYSKLKGLCYCRRKFCSKCQPCTVRIVVCKTFLLQTLKNICFKLVSCLVNSKCSSVYSEVKSEILFSSKPSVHVTQPKQHMQSSEFTMHLVFKP